MRTLMLALALLAAAVSKAEEAPAVPELPGAPADAAVIEAPPQNIEATPAKVAEELPKDSVPGKAVAEEPEPRFKLRNFLLGFAGGAALGAVFATFSKMPEWQGAAIGGPGLGLLALLAGATTAPEAKPPKVGGSVPSYAYQVQLLHLSF